MSWETITVLAIIVVIVIWAVAIYNGLITSRNRFKNGFAQIDVQLQRRYELIPNLVNTAKAYMSHERETLEAVTAARNTALGAAKAAAAAPDDASAIRNLGGAESALGAALLRFNAVAEAYPDIKANQTIGQLMEELSSTENRVAFSRQAFNDAVMNYNNQREKFPNSIVSNMFSFKEAEQLEIQNEQAREPVRVAF
ncbi:MAG: LemA family protein [Gammaproteobacteria bacterium]